MLSNTTESYEHPTHNTAEYITAVRLVIQRRQGNNDPKKKKAMTEQNHQ